MTRQNVVPVRLGVAGIQVGGKSYALHFSEALKGTFNLTASVRKRMQSCIDLNIMDGLESILSLSLQQGYPCKTVRGSRYHLQPICKLGSILFMDAHKTEWPLHTIVFYQPEKIYVNGMVASKSCGI